MENNFKCPRKRKKLFTIKERAFSQWCLLVPGIALVELNNSMITIGKLGTVKFQLLRRGKKKKEKSLSCCPWVLISGHYKLSSLKQFWLITCHSLIYQWNFSPLKNQPEKLRLTQWFDTRYRIDWIFGHLVQLPYGKWS